MDEKIKIVREFVKDNLRKLFGHVPNNDLIEKITNFIVDDEIKEVEDYDNELHIDYGYNNTYIKFGLRLLCDRYLLIKFTIIDEEGSDDVTYYYDILTGEYDIIIT